MMRFNSLQAFAEARDALDHRSANIYEFLSHQVNPMTDREVKDAMFPGGDVNMVRPRITELIKEGWLIEFASKRCKVTGKRVRVCKVVRGEDMLTPQEPQMALNL